MANPGRELVPGSLGGLGISSIDAGGGSFPVRLRTHLRRSERPLKWRGQVRAQPALPEITLASPRPLTAVLRGDGPKGTVDRRFYFSHARLSGLCASQHREQTRFYHHVEFIQNTDNRNDRNDRKLSLPQTVVKTRKYL